MTALGAWAAATWTFGALQFNGRWYCSRTCVEHAALERLDAERPSLIMSTALPPLKLGVLLRHQGAITQADLETALTAQRQTGLRIGEQLERLGMATADAVLRGLAMQSGVSYLLAFDVTRLARTPVSLPAPMVRALGLVPFEVDEELRRVSVVCAAPVPRAAVRALMTLTGWTVEVYLVTDGVFNAALDAYAPTPHVPVPHRTMTVESLAAAAAHVAEVAAHERAVTMRHAECNDYRWVRVQGLQQVSDLIVTREEAGCQAELTAH